MKDRPHPTGVAASITCQASRHLCWRSAEAHRQRPVQCFGDLVGIVRIDEQGRSQLPGSTREPAQHQDARVLRVLGSHELFGHQVHAVAQRCHQPHTRLAHVAGHGVARAPAGDQSGRRPIRLAPLAVNGPSLCIDRSAQILVGRNVRARGGRDLQEGHAAAPVRPCFQHSTEAVQSLDKPFGRIEAIDSQDQLLALQAAPQPLRRRRPPGDFRHAGELGSVDLGRKHAKADPPRVMLQAAGRQAYGASHSARGAREILQVVISLEADQIAGEQVTDKLAASGMLASMSAVGNGT